MKKLAAAILLLVYFTVTTGFVVSVHYCMNKVASVELGYDSHSQCGKCGMDIQKSDGCCKDDVKLVKMQVDHNVAKVAAPDFSLSLPPVVHVDLTNYSLSFLTPVSHPLAHGPPLRSPDRYLLHCVFRL